MSSDLDSDAGVVSGRETQFVPRSDDDEVLWEVQEITAERGKKYKVRWVGIDPATGKPWAQSWVAKHDCTDKLVGEWKAQKKKSAAGKKSGRTSTTSRNSGSSKRAGSSTSGKKTRASVSETTMSRLDPVEKDRPPAPEKPSTKRKRQSETPATTSSGTKEADEQGEQSRPHKKQRVLLEKLLPPISEDEDGDGGEVAADLPQAFRATVTPQKKALPSKNAALADVSDEEEYPPPRALGKPGHRADVRSKGTPASSRAADRRDESGSTRSKAKTKIVAQRNEHVDDGNTPSGESEVELLRPLPKLKKKLTSKRKSLLEQKNDLSEEGAEPIVHRIKVGPPRGIKRQEVVKQSGPLRERESSRAKPPENDFVGECVPAEQSKDQPEDEAATPLLMQHDVADVCVSTRPPPISIPIVSPVARSHSSDLSPGARARLELFDRMMVEVSQSDPAPPTDIPEPVLDDDVCYNFDDVDDALHAHDTFYTPDPPNLLSPPPKFGTPNGLIVPETESPGSSQNQSHLLAKLPSPQVPTPTHIQSPPKQIDPPSIAVTAASATSSSASPRDLIPPPQRHPLHVNRPSKRQAFKPVPQISPGTFRSTVRVYSRPTDSEAPPSSIESFTSPKRRDKGKQRAVEDDQLQSSLSEGVGDGERPRGWGHSKTTDSELRKRGKELFDRAQLLREAERQKKKKVKQLKTVDDIVNGMNFPSPKRPSLSSPGRVKNTLGTGWEDATLDTPEDNGTKPLNGEKWERLRIDLRQEEEESTQEAMGIHVSPPPNTFETMDDDVQMPPPRSPENLSLSGQVEDVDCVEPSADLHKASVIVQASQGPRQEDTDIEPSASNPLTSSPPCPIPEITTDSPKRRLGEALSLLNIKSEEIRRLERELTDERQNVEALKLEITEIRQSAEPTGPVLAAWEAERAEWTQERSEWENRFSVWQTERQEMSEKVVHLSSRVAELSDAADRAEETRAKLLASQVECAVQTMERDDMVNDMTTRLEEATDSINHGEYDQDRLKWETEKASWIEEGVRWETERSALQEKQEASLRSIDELTANVESMRTAKASAEKDRDFFREQYGHASGFVGSVREENVQLEKRVEIAEGQAREGVATIRAFFEGRVAALRTDVERWKALTELLQEKDRRTNDEVRLRAAQAPELEELCGRLDTENKSLKVDIRKLEHAQQRSLVKRNKLYCEIFAHKKERASLRSKLSQLAKMVGGTTQETPHSAPVPPILEDPKSIDPDDIEFPPDLTPLFSDLSSEELVLFPCMWRPQWRDQCQHVFDAKEDLERHLQEHFRDLVAQ